ncbi:MAG: glycosyltransferase [Acidobacteria bacterium]|nr:glycosyltransferase [Acidobacteriota bacterium]
MNMKIVHALGWYFPDSLGGTEVYVAGLARRQQSAGHDVTVVAPDPANPHERTYLHDGLPVYRFPIPPNPTREECQGLTVARGAERFHEWLMAQSPDVVHFHSYVTGVGLRELRLAKQTGARVVVTNHLASLGFVCQRGTLMYRGQQLCDGISSPTKCAACCLEERGIPFSLASLAAAIPIPLSRLAGQVPGKIGTLLGMSDFIHRNQQTQREQFDVLDRFVLLNQWAFDAVVANGAPPKKLAINRLGVSYAVSPKPSPATRPTTTPVKIGYLGRLVDIKGVHDLARAISSLPTELPLQIEFRGPLNNAESKATLTRLKEIVGNDPRVEFAPAAQWKDVPAILAGYDLLCCPSLCLEGGPTVAIESHAVGTPVIGTKIGGMAEFITDRVNGRLVEPGNWRALAEVLREVAADPGGTIDRWRTKLPAVRTMDEITADYLELYQS